LNGDHAFHRFNPAAGLSYQPRPWLGGYASYSESSRAPTAIELTCASPTDPCRLPNAFVADPPLDQVVARTIEAGLRGSWAGNKSRLRYAAAAFRTTDAHDILFISSGMVANQGYFSNVGQTRRQGVEASLSGWRHLGKGRLEWDLDYTLTDATFETPFTALSATHPDARDGRIDVPAGARIPSIPRHSGKVGLTVLSGFGLMGGADLIAQSGQYLRGDEANRLAPLPGHALVNARLEYAFRWSLSAFVLVNNVFDARYETFGVLGDARDVLGPSYGNPRFAGPGAPRAAWVGLALRR
jgi:iron complex outermembrane receptor protein